MRLERVGGNQIKIFLTFDELAERGIEDNELRLDSQKWNELFFEMIHEANTEFDLSIEGNILIDIFSMHSQGMVLLLTLNEDEEPFFGMREEGLSQPEYDNHTLRLIYKFKEVEDVIQFALRIHFLYEGGHLLFFNDEYYLSFELHSYTLFSKLNLILSEYGESSNQSLEYLQEYGRTIISNNAIEIINKYFA